MAVQTIYLLGTTAVTPNWFGNTQLNGTAPTGANSAFGWGPAKTAVTTPYFRGRIGATAVSGDTPSASTTITSSILPRKGTGAGASTAGDSFIAGPFNGVFATGTWTFNFNLRAGTAGAVGHVNIQVWKSANADGTGATLLLGQTAGATVTLSTSADVNSIVSSGSLGAPTFANEYLFVQVEWQETTAGSSNNDNVLFRIGTSSIVTPNFSGNVDLAGNLDGTQTAFAAPLNADRVIVGDFAPSTTFGANVTVTPATTLAGNVDLTTAVTFNGDLTIAPPSSINVALASRGGVASASSTYPGNNFAAVNVIDGIRDPTQGGGWSYGGGWNDDTNGVFPDTFDVTFNAVYSIAEIDIITLADDFSTPHDPTLADTFTAYGVTSFVVQYWDGSAFQTLYSTTTNNHVWTQIQFAPVLTNQIHLVINDSADHTWSRLVEVEAWTAVHVPATIDLAGDLPCSTVLSAFLAEDETIVGSLAPSVALAGDLSILVPLAGGLSPSIALSAWMAEDETEVGDLAPSVAFAADLSIVKGGAPQSVWSASDALAANSGTTPTTLSNGGLDFTPTVNAYVSTLRTTIAKRGGKLYVEFYAKSTGGNMGWGVANAQADPSRGMSQSNNPGSAAWYYGTTAATPGFTANYSSTLWPQSGTTVGMAVDFTTGGVWFALNNVWLNGSDPSINSLPMISFDATVGPLFAAAGPGQVSDTWTLRALPTNQIYGPPVGFRAWDAPGSTYGTGSYGKGPYSALGVGPVDIPGDLKPIVTLAGTLNTDAQAAGDLAPSVTLQGGVLNIDAGLVGNLPPSIVFQAILSAYEDEGGDLRPTVTLAATLSADMVIAGDLAPSVSFSASLQGFVDASANLAPGVTFAADTLDVLPATSFSADLAPSVVLAANLTGTFGVSADLAPSVAFSADTTITPATTLQGDLAPSVAFSGSTTITAATALQGDLEPDVSLDGDLTTLTGFLGVLAPSVTFSAPLSVTPPDELVADFTASVTFQGDTIALTAALRGDLPPSTTLGADIDIVPPVELGGNLIPLASLAADALNYDAGVRGDFAATATFDADLDIVKELKGNLAPQAAFQGALILVPPTDLSGGVPALVDLSGSLIAFPAIGMAGGIQATATFALSGLEGDWVIQGDLKPSVSFTGALTGYADLKGDLAPQVAFALKPNFDWATFGDLSPGVALAGSIGVTPATELQGDLPPVAQFIADLDIVPPVELAGDLKPGVVLSAYLASRVYLEADMRAQPFLGDPLNGADLGMMVDLRGNMFPLVTLQAPVFGKVIGLQGNLACSTTLSDGGVGLEDYTPTSFVIIECGVF